jgi:predicted MPP superfamily phosphohydrolase
MRRRWRWWAVVAACAVLGLGLRAFWLEPASLRVTASTIELPPGSPALDGLRVAVLADLHVGSPWNGLDKLARIVAETNAAAPDVVLLAGDYVIKGVIGGSFVAPEAIAARLHALHAPLGVYAVLGNHDWWLDAARVRTALAAAAIPTLDDRALAIDGGGRRFWLCGVSDFWEGAHDVHRALAGVTDDAPVILFTHNPDVFPHVPARVALTVAGHTHGGQVFVPILGRPIVPSRYGQRYAIGHVVEDGRHLFVSPGLGTSIIPVRFRVPPEISLVTLRAPP